MARSSAWLAATGLLILGVVGFESGAQPPGQKPMFPPPPTTQDSGGEPGLGGPEHGGLAIRELTTKEINRIRYMELRGMRMDTPQVDRVTVKIPSNVVEDFLQLMEGDREFPDKQSRQEFRKLTPPQKLHVMARKRGVEFVDRVEITTDPEIFVEFRRRIMPIVLLHCANAGCHGPSGGSDLPFHFFNDPKKLPKTTYANFIMLNDLAVGGHTMIDRAHPDDSLLLTYMLPAMDVKADFRHPGKDELKPVYQNTRVAGFQRIRRWIASLKHPAEDYGVHFDATSQPSGREPGEEPAPQP